MPKTKKELEEEIDYLKQNIALHDQIALRDQKDKPKGFRTMGGGNLATNVLAATAIIISLLTFQDNKIDKAIVECKSEAQDLFGSVSEAIEDKIVESTQRAHAKNEKDIALLREALQQVLAHSDLPKDKIDIIMRIIGRVEAEGLDMTLQLTQKNQYNETLEQTPNASQLPYEKRLEKESSSGNEHSP